MASGFDANTNALSVYNVLSVARKPLAAGEIVSVLQRRWNAGFDAGDLNEALVVLGSLKAVRSNGDTFDVHKRKPNGRGPRLMRDRPGLPLYFAEGSL